MAATVKASSATTAVSAEATDSRPDVPTDREATTTNTSLRPRPSKLRLATSTPVAVARDSEAMVVDLDVDRPGLLLSAKKRCLMTRWSSNLHRSERV